VDIGGVVPDPVWQEAAKHWSETALVEIVVMSATFAYFNRIANALEIEPTV
jgi:alkylhydroperoxidase family enzyme